MLGDAVGAVTTVTWGSWSGDPRDGYARAITLECTPTVSLSPRFQFAYEARSPDDDAPPSITSLSGILSATAGSFSERFPVWEALREGLSRLGCQDTTLENTPRAIVDAADLRGFPNLETLFLSQSPIATLDVELVTVCPALRRAALRDTPLAGSREHLATLRAARPGVRIDAE